MVQWVIGALSVGSGGGMAVARMSFSASSKRAEKVFLKAFGKTHIKIEARDVNKKRHSLS